MTESVNLKQLSLLLVDDEIKTSESVVGLLKRRAGSVYVGYDGEEGLELFHTHHPDIVITDIMMPKMNGLELCRAIKNIAPDTPVLVMSAFEENEFLHQAIELGIDSYLLKPIDFEKLKERLRILADRIAYRRQAENFNKELQRQVAEKTEALERSNSELQKFNSELDVKIKERSEELLQQKTFLDNVIETSNVVVLVLDEKADILFLNRYGLQLTGYQEPEVLGQNWVERFIPEKNRRNIRTIFHEVYDDDQNYWDFENSVLCKSGEERILQWRNSLLKDAEGHTSGILSIALDVTERKLAQEKEKRLSTMLHNIHLATKALMKKDHALEQVLQRVCDVLLQNENYFFVQIDLKERGKLKLSDQLFGSSERDPLALSLPLIHGYDRPSWGFLNIRSQHMGGWMEEEKQILEEFASMIAITIQASQQEREILKLNHTLESKVEEKTRQLRENLEDLQKKNIELEQAKQEALLASQAKSMFVSHVSHELRTPLNAIINFTDQIIEDFDLIKENEVLQKESKDFLIRVLKNSHHLLELINEILDFTKAKEGKINYQLESCDANEVLRQVYQNYRAMVDSDQIKFVLDITPEPLPLITDQRRFFQVMTNLLSNAMKFTQKGHITLRSKSNGADAIVELEDTGRGIPHDKLEMIFDPFGQVDQFDKGTGLGLAIVKEMCKNMKMEVEVQSDLGKGTLFRITTKLAQLEEHDAQSL